MIERAYSVLCRIKDRLDASSELYFLAARIIKEAAMQMLRVNRGSIKYVWAKTLAVSGRPVIE